MKSMRIFSILCVSAAMLLTTRCKEEEGLTYNVNDVSTRVTGFGSEKTGAGAELIINGTKLQNVDRVFIGNDVVRSALFVSQTESQIVLNVPTSVTLGMKDVLVVFPGPDRAYEEIEVVPFQAMTSILPGSAAEGETVTLLGVNFDIVTSVKVGDVAATIVSQTPTMLKFTMPAGATTGRVFLTSNAGVAKSGADLVACSAAPTSVDCTDGLNLNDGFELGSGDNFDNWSKFNGGGFMVQTTAANEVYRGARALKVVRDGSLGTGEWRIQLASDAVATDAGASYTVYMWARASAAGGALRVSTSPDAKYTANQNVTTAWQRLAFTFSPGGGNAINTTSTQIVLDFNGNNTAVTQFFIDDVKLIKN